MCRRGGPLIPDEKDRLMFDGLFNFTELHFVPIFYPKQMFQYRFDLIGKDIIFREDSRFGRSMAFLTTDKQVTHLIIQTYNDSTAMTNADLLIDLLRKDQVRIVATQVESNWTLALKTGNRLAS